MTKTFMGMFVLVIGLTFGTVPVIFAEEDPVTKNEDEAMMEPKENHGETSPAEESFVIETTLGTDEKAGTDEQYKEGDETPSEEPESDLPKID